MDVVSFMEIEEDEKDLIISFALDDEDGDIKSFMLHRTLFYEFIMPDEERGTKVSLEGDYLAPSLFRVITTGTWSSQTFSMVFASVFLRAV
jgi:hypothetical protein